MSSDAVWLFLLIISWFAAGLTQDYTGCSEFYPSCTCSLFSPDYIDIYCGTCLPITKQYCTGFPTTSQKIAEKEVFDLSFLKKLLFQRVKRIRNLSISGGYFKIIPTHFFTLVNQTVERLILVDSNIFEIENDAFAGLEDHLRTLTLSSNYISHCCNFSPLPNLQLLHLDHNLITSLPPDAFFNLTSLIELDFSNNNITSIENALWPLQNLMYLNLHNNNLKSLSNSSFSGLIHLEKIKLFSNQLKSLPKGIFYNLTKLHSVYIDKNNLEYIEDSAFENLPNLFILNLAENQLTILSKYSFISLPTLFDFNLSANNIIEFEKGFFQNFPNLSFLHLHQNQIKKIDKYLIRNLSALIDIDLSNNYIDQMDELALDGLFSLKVLLLSSNRLKSIRESDFANLNQLKVLDLQNNTIDTIETKAFRNLNQLQFLHLNSNFLSGLNKSMFEGLYQLESLFLQNNKLVELDENSFFDLSQLRVLDISNNRLKNIPARCFDSLVLLEQMNISHNEIVQLPEDACVLLAGISGLDLSHNKFMDIPTILLENMMLVQPTGQSKYVTEVPDIPHNLSETTILEVAAGQFVDLSFNMIQHIVEESFTCIQNKDALAVAIQGNPLVCDCNLGWLSKWLSGRKNLPRTLILQIVCYEPQQLKNQAIINIPSNEFICNITSSSPLITIEAAKSLMPTVENTTSTTTFNSSETF